jgi:glucokinase
MTSRIYLGGLDIGATKIAAVVGDQGGNFVAHIAESLSFEGGRFAAWGDGTAYDGLSSQATRLLERGMKTAGIGQVGAIGIGSAGPLTGGAIVNSTNIKLSHIPTDLPSSPLYLPLTEPIRQYFDVPVVLENDANAAVLGEVYYGEGKKTAAKERLSLVYVTLSTGLGAGIWSEGRLLRGKDGNAGEIGHFVVREVGLQCGCGNIGCAEAYCSGRGMVENAKVRLLEKGLSASLPLLQWAEEAARDRKVDIADRMRLLQFIDPPTIFEAAKAQDPVAREVIREAVLYGGMALADVANAYDPEVITVGGGVGLHQPDLVKAMEREMLRHLSVRPPRVRITSLGDRAVLYGAIALAKQALAES